MAAGTCLLPCGRPASDPRPAGIEGWPDGFRFVVKAPAALTDPAIRRAGSGEPARDNPRFLDAAAAAATFVQPAVAGLAAKAGPLVFQFPPLGRRLLADVPRLLARLAALAALAIRAAATGRDAFITINNKAEGSAPLSVVALARRIATEA